MNERVLEAGAFQIEKVIEEPARPGADELTWSDILDEDALSHLRRILVIVVVSVIWISFSDGPPGAQGGSQESSAVSVMRAEGPGETPGTRGPATPQAKLGLTDGATESRQAVSRTTRERGGTSFERSLLIPVEGVTSTDLLDTFHDKRGASRTHQAIDIMVAARTPVLAADDGIISRLATEPGGGIALYQKDPTTRYVYYYAHLDEYASGIEEGLEVRKGELLGYVGSTGNARTPHLHFAVRLRGGDRRWWKGEAVNPYPILVGGDWG